MDSITLKEVLQEMRKTDANGDGLAFSLSAFTFNDFTKKGGKLKHYTNARLVMRNVKKKRTLSSMTRSASLLSKEKKYPEHFKNSTINIEFEEANVKNIRKIKIRYIKLFNDKIVNY
ncbi:hypothetical protein [Tenacibaculum sp. nBUS_03]|uniref:hypothetical protein n=1 Tax=Tenacibaculum sp. nBUS_03 TaxID=3395320 RepID=UPI003EBD8038